MCSRSKGIPVEFRVQVAQAIQFVDRNSRTLKLRKVIDMWAGYYFENDEKPINFYLSVLKTLVGE